ncbi:hypothetical protein EMCRGX_G032597 [Ephydatia muelleri]
MDYHNQQVPIHCRVCGQRLTKYRAKKSISYECKAFSAELKIAFDINTSGDDVNIHPEMFCIHCKLSMQRTICAITKGVHHKCAVILFEWEKHTDQECKVCDHFRACSSGHLRRPTVGRGRQAGVTPNLLIAHLEKIAPPPVLLHEPSPPLASVNNQLMLKELKCAVCSNILSQPLELLCGALVCAKCLQEWIAASGAVNCPCCSEGGPLVSSHVRPAPGVILLLLSDVLVHCTDCSRDVKAGDYEGHECVPSLTPEEEKQAAGLLKRAISTSPDKGIIQLPTGGTPMTFMHVTRAHQETTAACSRTVKTRCFQMQKIRGIVSGGEASALIQKEVLILSDEERRSLLDKAGISSSIELGAAEVLAIKAGLAIPWNKLRLLRRWLKSSGICLAGEERMRHISSQIVGDNLKGEIAPFSVTIPSGGEEIKGAPLVFIPHLVDKVVQLLDGNERTGRLTWHKGFIPANEIWLKIGGDKGGGTFKMTFQIVNVATPNSVHNTCVFSCFAAGDSVTNLHVALDRFKDQVEHLHGMKWRQYTVKVFICGDYEFLSKMYGLSGASGCYPCLYCKIPSDQMATPLSVRGHATERSLEDMCTDHQCYISSGSIRKDAQKFFNCISVPIFDIPVSQMFHLLEALCCQLDLELASRTTDFDSSNFSKYSQALQRLPLLQGDLKTAQHSQQVLQQVPNIQTLCTSISKMALEKLPHRSGEVAGQVSKFITAFSLYGTCHNICDQNFIDAAQAHALDQAIQEFMAFFRDTYPEATVPIKMHLLEDHTVQWANTNHVGFGLLGEQGAESIHAKFNRLGLAFAPIKDHVQNLMCTVREHLLSIEPQLVAAIPPPAKRVKNTIAM